MPAIKPLPLRVNRSSDSSIHLPQNQGSNYPDPMNFIENVSPPFSEFPSLEERVYEPDFEIIPSTFRKVLASLPKILNPESQLNTKIEGLEDKLKKKFDEANLKIAKDIAEHIKKFLEKSVKKDELALFGKNTVESSLDSMWVSIPVVSSAENPDLSTQSWQTQVENKPLLAASIFASLSDSGYNWYSPDYNVDLYKKDGSEIAVYWDNSTLNVTAFK